MQYNNNLIEIGENDVKLKWPTPSIPTNTKSLTLDPNERDYLPLILNARVYDVCEQTPLFYARKLSSRLGNTIYVKREDLQPVFSFKCRGGFNKMFHLTKEEKAKGVCCASAGNHAQGVALAAQKLGIKARIVMPIFAPEIKVENVRRLGAEVVLFGNSFDEAKKECLRIIKEENLVFVPPFDDPLVIAGQGTVGMEILNQIRQTRLDAIFVCCGGGGLLAGIAAYVKRVRPEVKIIGVNTVDSDGMYQSLLAGKAMEIPHAGLFSDGTSVKLVGSECFRICNKYVDDMILVTNDEICAAIKDGYDETRCLFEPAGALGLAGLKKYLNQNPSMKNGVFVAVASGANMNFDRLRFVAERAAMGEGREALFSVKMPEKCGSLNTLLQYLEKNAITEVAYRYSTKAPAHVFLGFLNTIEYSAVSVLEKINKASEFKAIDITKNDMASMHVRYMSGGRNPVALENEVLLRFRLPEIPSALPKSIELLTADCNITLIHYRNHGADFGRVLLGFQVMKGIEVDTYKSKYIHDLEKLGCVQIFDETTNEVYDHFFK